ncbi:tRNA lysidine(34) synthetase TilS [Bacillus sp. M6-12]|uniref:tRNA lysidine(34) synthetase TilS n=1 Tax=Bacillus sp. M6-12 TaxID=2054166 RepID=UPI000C774112|nr:tRNA lysidine(34) synthetase TilS [Bacillus sp. M6-12]PLS15136.1 tRNA lysidine(34) synthetase TilS [Bacillus sp. M6-12]
MLEIKVRQNIVKHGLFPKGSRVLAGVSGGPDSLALLHFLCSLRKEVNLEIVVAHVDHMFRGDESYEDYLFVRDICEEWDVIFEGIRINVQEYIERTGESSQIAARNLRYGFYREMMDKHQLGLLALGHHGDDQIETILMRLTRGAGGAARAGIVQQRPFGPGKIVRPFLSASRQEIENYVERHQLTPRLDPSNKKDVYIRNRFRKMVLPFLKRENPKVHEHFQRFSEELIEDEALLMNMAEAKMAGIWLEQGKERSTISLPILLAMPKPLQRRAIQLILKYLYNMKPSSLSALHIEQLLALFLNPHPSAELHLPEGLIAEKSYNICTFQYSKVESDNYSCILPIPGEINLPNGNSIIVQYIEELPSISGNDTFIIRESDISLPLIARNRKNGDRMKIKGMDGTKKLKDIFINEKIPLPERDAWPVVTDSNGEVLWLPGLKKTDVELSDKVSEQLLIFLQYKKA